MSRVDLDKFILNAHTTSQYILQVCIMFFQKIHQRMTSSKQKFATRSCKILWETKDACKSISNTLCASTVSN